jgi:hypothetical protein
MICLYAAVGSAVAVITQQNGRWVPRLALEGLDARCLAADPARPERVYCGTFGRGLWVSDDAGTTWAPVGDGITSDRVMAVAVSPIERAGGYGIVWAGTEPSALFRSEDGGKTWHACPALTRLPSAPTWSFPPRPWTHHVRWIEPDPVVAGRLFVGIELGGVMRSLDGGLTWEDRKPGSQFDCHTLRTHRRAPGRVYEAAGGGYAESLDGGASWRGFDAGLPWHYLWGLAVDPADPDTMIVSASPGARQAHGPRSHQTGDGEPPAGASASIPWAESVICRRTGGGPWQEVRAGLPDPHGTLAYVLAAHDAEPGVFYAAPHHGAIYRSADRGENWERLDIAWPAGYRPERTHALAAVSLP